MAADTLQELISCSGGSITLLRSTFRVDKTVVVPSGTTLDGSGSVIQTQLDGGHTFLIRDCEDVCLRNLEIRGGWNPYFGEVATVGTAIRIERSRNVLIENVTIGSMMGRGIVATPHVSDLTIRGCHISDCSISIFLFKDTKCSIIESNRISDSRLIGIYVDDAAEGDTKETSRPNHNTIIRGNIIQGGGTSPMNTGFGIAVSGSTDTIIANNIVSGFGTESRKGHGIVLNNGQDKYNQGQRTVVSGNILSDNTGYGLYVVEQESAIILGNVYSGNGLGDYKLIGLEA